MLNRILLCIHVMEEFLYHQVYVDTPNVKKIIVLMLKES